MSILQGWQGWPVSARTVLFFGFLGGAILIALFSRITSISFCGSEFSIPDGCDADSKHQLECDDCSMSWSYVDGNMLQYLADQANQEIQQHNYPSTNENITCYLLGTKVNAFKILSKKNNYHETTIIAYGIVKKHSVLVKLSVPHALVDNENIPSGARQIISLTE